MKKHLIAAAVAAAVAVPAMAQNVTVYGTLDVGYQRADNGADTYLRSANGAIATSRLGFRGTEDLGGGLKANFMIQGQLPMATNIGGSAASNTTPTDTNAAAAGSNFTFNEETWVGLSGGFGEIRIGRTDVTSAESIDTTVSQMGNLGQSTVFTGTTTGELGGNSANVIRYISPSISGFSFQLGHAGKNNAGATTDTNTPIRSVGLSYVSGPLGVHAGYSKQKATGIAGSELDHTAVGASYDFGVASVGYYYSDSDQSGTSNSSNVERNNLTVKVPVGSGVALHGGYFTAKEEGSENKGSGYTFAVTKAMSKRTTVYGAFSDNESKGTAAFAITGTSAPTSGQDSSALTFGVIHSF